MRPPRIIALKAMRLQSRLRSMFISQNGVFAHANPMTLAIGRF